MLKITFNNLLFVFLIFACQPNDSIEEEIAEETNNSLSSKISSSPPNDSIQEEIDVEVNNNLSSKISSKKSSNPPNYYGVYILTYKDFETSGIKKFLSTTSSGNKVDLYHTDDGSKRQKWNFIFQGYDSNNRPYYHIEIAGGVYTNRKYLSTVYNGSKVDLWHTDDGSGRQRWIIKGYNFPYLGWLSISAVGGVYPWRKYLSIANNRSKVDLFKLESIYTPGNQSWVVTTDPNGTGGSFSFD